MRPGANADIFVTRIQKNPLDIVDKFGETVHLEETFVPMLTLKEGRPAYRNILFDPY